MKPIETDSIRELAAFWDSHDLSDFADQLEEVTEPLFVGRPAAMVTVPLTRDELDAIRRIASSRGIEESAVIHEWVREKLLQ